MFRPPTPLLRGLRNHSFVDDAPGLALGAFDALGLDELHLEAEADDTAELGFELLLQTDHRRHVVGEVLLLDLDLQFGGVGIVDTVDNEQEVGLVLGELQDDILDL